MHGRIGIALFAGAALALASLTGGDRGLTTQSAFAEEQAESAPAAVEIAIRDDRFVDARLTVPVGTTVTWAHKGNNTHTTSSLNGEWDSGTLLRGDTFSFTFDTPGVYQYLCRQHLLQGMRGTITVEAP